MDDDCHCLYTSPRLVIDQAVAHSVFRPLVRRNVERAQCKPYIAVSVEFEYLELLDHPNAPLHGIYAIFVYHLYIACRLFVFVCETDTFGAETVEIFDVVGMDVLREIFRIFALYGREVVPEQFREIVRYEGVTTAVRVEYGNAAA